MDNQRQTVDEPNRWQVKKLEYRNILEIVLKIDTGHKTVSRFIFFFELKKNYLL